MFTPIEMKSWTLILALMAGAKGNAFVLQDDNAGPHRARIVDAYLKHETIQHMQWPARSLGLNPVDNVWDALEHRVASLNLSPRNLVPLSTALEGQSFSLPTELIDHIIESITHTHRCMYCIYFSGRSYRIIIVAPPHTKLAHLICLFCT
ncbi:DDE_3 domain-containing protein [Trichonephila clavipes]|nr:DDE_3 domain-containing protein [Trichonephila clavipes]